MMWLWTLLQCDLAGGFSREMVPGKVKVESREIRWGRARWVSYRTTENKKKIWSKYLQKLGRGYIWWTSYYTTYLYIGSILHKEKKSLFSWCFLPWVQPWIVLYSELCFLFLSHVYLHNLLLATFLSHFLLDAAFKYRIKSGYCFLIQPDIPFSLQ